MKKVDKRIVFYGGGKMAESIIRGLLGNDTLNPENITVGAVSYTHLDVYKRQQVHCGLWACVRPMTNCCLC